MKYRHPLANAQQARLDIIHGGSEDEIMTECFRIMKDAVPTLERDESIFFINSLVGRGRFEPKFNKLVERFPDQVRGATYYGKLLMDRFELIRFIIPHCKIRLVILNSFELAVFNSRHRMQLLELIKWMRDDLGIRLVICMQNPPLKYGAQGSLKLMASSIEHAGGHLAALKEKAKIGAMPAEMHNVGFPYKNEPASSISDEPAETVAARERGIAARNLAGQRIVQEAAQAREALTPKDLEEHLKLDLAEDFEATVADPRKPEFDEADERELELDESELDADEGELEADEREQTAMLREMREKLAIARARNNGFTEEEESYAAQCIAERDPGPNYSPFSKGYELENV